jgi:hypothetical protein
MSTTLEILLVVSIAINAVTSATLLFIAKKIRRVL